MAKPIIKKITPFDVTEGTEIEIMWTGEIPSSHKVMIYNNETDVEVYNKTVDTPSLKHTINPNDINSKFPDFKNGGIWYMRVQIYDRAGIASTLSDKVLFYTFTKPDFYFQERSEKTDTYERLEDGYLVKKSSYQANVYYHSIDNENISSYEFYIYDNTKYFLNKTDTLHDIENIVYSYRGLENRTEYYIRCKGITVNGMELDTDYVKISVDYENPSQYAMLYAKTLEEQGCVQLSSNIIVIEADGEEIYNYEDGFIDLDDKTLIYSKGFEIDDDFSLAISGKHLWQTDTILTLNNEVDSFSLTSRIYTDGKLRFRLLISNGVTNYIIYSEALEFTNEDVITILIKRKDNIYDIETRIDI